MYWIAQRYTDTTSGAKTPNNDCRHPVLLAKMDFSFLVLVFGFNPGYGRLVKSNTGAIGIKFRTPFFKQHVLYLPTDILLKINALTPK